MFSSETVPNIIEKIDKWTQEELAENINDVLPTLTTSLKTVEQKSLTLRSVHILLARCLTCVPVSQINSDILQHALPTAKDIFKEALEGITIVLQDAENLSDEEMELTLRSLHHVCFGLIDELKNVLHTVTSFGPLSASKVASVPCTVLQLLQIAFTHCHISEELYGSTHQYLMSLFNSSQMLLSCLQPLLCSELQFDLKYEEDEILLRNVLEELGQVAKSTTSLGVTVQTAAWTTYVTLVERYRAYAEIWAAIDVSSPVATLASSVLDTMLFIFDAHGIDITVIVKALTILSFLVRILTKLCSIFTSHLTDTCMPSLYRLLELLLRSCVNDACSSEEKSILFKEAEQRVGVAAASLISSLLSDRSFVQIYFLMNQKPVIDAPLGKLLMGASICRALVGSDFETRKLWISNPDEHIVTSIFHLMGFCHPELCGNMKFVAVSGKGKSARVTDLYEYILTSVGTLTLLVPSSGFGLVETVLVKNLTQSNQWKGLFAMDLWCIIARQSPENVRVRHTMYFLELLSSQQSVQCSPSQILLRMLLHRLWPLLPSRHQIMLLNKYSPLLMPEVWASVCPDTLMLECEVPNDFLDETCATIENFVSNPNVEAFTKMMKRIKSAVIFLTVESNLAKSKPFLLPMTSSLSTLWSLIDNPLIEFMNECWLSNFFSTVCDLTEKLSLELSNSQLGEILRKSLDILSTSDSSHLKLRILNMLKALAVKVFASDSQQQRVFQELGNIFATAIQDNSCIVQQEALHTFEYFAHVTSHEDILKYCLKQSKTMKEKVTLYLKKNASSIERDSKDSAYTDYLILQNQVKFFHKCKDKLPKPNLRINANQLTDFPLLSIPSVEKNNVSDSEIFSAIQRLQKDSLFVSKVCKNISLSKSTKVQVSVEMDKVMKSVSEIFLLLKE